MANNKGKLGLLDTTMILVGGMIGSAIFSLSGVTIAGAGPAALISWVFGGLILYVYGLETAELATIFPTSGGVFTFPQKTLGKTEKASHIWGWISCWAYLFGCIGGAVFSSTYVATYLGAGFPIFKNTVLIAIVVAILCGLLNIFNIQLTGAVNTGLTVLLLATLAVFIFAAFFSGQWDATMFSPFFTQGSYGATGFLSVTPIAMVAYGSIVAAAFMVGEIKSSEKTMPKAMAIALVIVMAFYVLVLVATLGLVSAGFLAENPGMTYIPLYAAAFTKLAGIPWLVKLISISAVLALVTTILVTMALGARGIQAAAAGGILPKALAKNSEKTGVPVNATIVITVIVAIFAAFPQLTNFIVNFGSLCNAICVVLICLSVISARKKYAGQAKFHAPGGNVLAIIAMAIIVLSYLVGAVTDWKLWAYTVGYFVIGMIIYAISGAGKDKSKTEAAK